jgi:sigma-B regulation protein RsbU (phosphoserine phosphatase)
MSERLEQAPCAFVEFGDDGIVTYANAMLAELVGIQASALPGKKFESLLTLPNRIFFQTHLFPLLKLHGRAAEVFLGLRGPDGTPVPVITSGVRRGAIIQCVFLPIIERSQYESEILHARRTAEAALKSDADLVAARSKLEAQSRNLDRRVHELDARNEELVDVSRALSHDLREPMRKVRSFAEVVGDSARQSLDPEGAMALQKIFSESDRAVNLIVSVQRYLDADDPSAPITSVELNSVIAAAERHVKQNGAKLEVDVSRLPAIAARPKQLEVLFIELFDNAVKFCRPDVPPRVVISGRVIQLNSYQATKDRYAYGDFVQLEIADNGRGFDPKYNDYVFGLMKKIEVDSAGTGIGLAVCRKIARAHYGTIEANAVPNVGVTTVLRLPVTHEDEPA